MKKTKYTKKQNNKLESHQEFYNRVQNAIAMAYNYNNQEVFMAHYYHGYIPNIKSYEDILKGGDKYGKNTTRKQIYRSYARKILE
jgi:hypothetical protein